MSAVALYRDFELPWTPSEDEQRRLRRILGAVLGLFIAFGVIIPLLPEPPKSGAAAGHTRARRRVPARAAKAEADSAAATEDRIAEAGRAAQARDAGREAGAARRKNSRSPIRSRRRQPRACSRCRNSWPNCGRSTSRTPTPGTSTPARARRRALTGRCSPPRSAKAAAESPCRR